jgi:cellulose synthase/poly-beta-1,6-N-acetylglucosamine synthase-like glycosyltransferase
MLIFCPQIEEGLQHHSTTVTLEMVDSEAGELATCEIAPGMPLRISTVLKSYNGRKHNSHEWFLRGAAAAYKSDAVFLTDCGTLLGTECLKKALDWLLDHPLYCAVSGQPRPTSFEPPTSLLQVLHTLGQQYESSAALLGLTSGFASIGFSVSAHVAVVVLLTSVQCCAAH